MTPLWRRCGLTSGRGWGLMPSVSGVQRACKPGSVAKTGQARSPDGHSSGPKVAPWFSRPTTAAARKPALSRRGRNTLRYLGLLRVGFTLPLPLLVARCALTAPFHPYHRTRSVRGRFAFCGTVPGLAPAGGYPAPCFRGARTFLTNPEGSARPSGPLQVLVLGQARDGVKVFQAGESCIDPGELLVGEGHEFVGQAQ